MQEEKAIKKSELAPAVNNGLIELFAACPLINEKDIKNLESAKNFIVETYSSVPMYRPLAIKLLGVLSNKEHPTNESKLWQCKVEAEVHANELVRDMHDLEKLKLHIEKNDYLLNQVMKDKLAELENDKETIQNKHKKAEIEFDMRELSITISQQKFELFQLQKRIKYRIEEVHEWKLISEKLVQSGTKNIPYGEMLIESYHQRWTEELKKPDISDEEKKNLQSKLSVINSKIRNQQ
jgi:hypothetical protein